MEKTKDIILPPLSRKKAAQERKAERKRESDRASYQKNREAKIAQVQEMQTSDPRVVKAGGTNKD